MEKTIKVEITPMLASCLQRMLVDEIENQEQWLVDDEEMGISHSKIREEIIDQCEELREQLTQQGVAKHFKCY